MKKILEKTDIRSLTIGFIIGLFVALFVFSALVPSGLDMIRVYNLQRYHNLRGDGIEVEQNYK